MNEINDLVVSQGARYVGGVISIVAFAILLKCESKLSTGGAFVGALASFFGALLVEYIPLLITFIDYKPANPMDLLTLRVIQVSSTLVSLGYAFALFAIWRFLRTLFQRVQGAEGIGEGISARTSEGGDARSETLSDLATAMRRGEGSSIKSRIFAPVSAYSGSAFHPPEGRTRPSFGVAVAVSSMRALILALFIAAILPGAASAYFLRQDEWGIGLGIGIPWLICFITLAIVLHKRDLIHISVSVGGAIALLAGVAFLN